MQKKNPVSKKKTGFVNLKSIKLLTYFLLTLSLRAFPGLNLGHLDAAILSVSPVFGLRPVRAARLPTPNVPKPISETSCPFESSLEIVSIVALRAASESFFDNPVSFAIASTNSALFIIISPLNNIIFDKYLYSIRIV